MNISSEFLAQLSIAVLPIVFAIILHEVMHGFVALQLGDDTAQRAGRLTLNPLSHVDPFGTVIMPLALLYMGLPVFGYAKPVPVDFGRLRNPRSGMLMVAAAGPLTNIVLAVASSIGLRIADAHIAGPWGRTIVQPIYLMLETSLQINVMLAIFNLMPLLPLDGGRVVVSLLPRNAARAFSRLEPFGFLILLVLLYTNSIRRMISPIIDAIVRVLL